MTSSSYFKLFVKESGEPMCFFMTSCPVKATVEKMIVDYGGLMVPEGNGPHTVHLFPRDEQGYGEVGDIFSTQYVYDCVDKQEILPIISYRLNQKSRFNGDINPINVLLGKRSWSECVPTGEDSNRKGSDLDATPQNMKMVRTPYVHCERKAILKYIIENKSYSAVKGRKLWENMSDAQICPGRSWQSLKQHFRTNIMRDLTRFELPDEIVKQLLAPYSSIIKRIKKIKGKYEEGCKKEPKTENQLGQQK